MKWLNLPSELILFDCCHTKSKRCKNRYPSCLRYVSPGMQVDTTARVASMKKGVSSWPYSSIHGRRHGYFTYARRTVLISKFRPTIIYPLRNQKEGKDRVASQGAESLNSPTKYRLLHLSHSVHLVGPTKYSIRHFGNLFAHTCMILQDKGTQYFILAILGKSQCLFTYACMLLQDEDIHYFMYAILGRELQCLLTHAWSHTIQSILFIPFQGGHTCMMAKDTKHFIYSLLEKS